MGSPKSANHLLTSLCKGCVGLIPLRHHNYGTAVRDLFALNTNTDGLAIDEAFHFAEGKVSKAALTSF